MAREKEYTEIVNSLKNVRRAAKMLHEGEMREMEFNDNDAVPYTQQDSFMTDSIESAKQQFGADFSKCKTPMLYYPKDGDVIMSGIIPSLNNAKFQFRRLGSSGGGCYFWVEDIQLTDETVSKINKILGVYKNWIKKFDSTEDFKPISLNNM